MENYWNWHSMIRASSFYGINNKDHVRSLNFAAASKLCTIIWANAPKFDFYVVNIIIDLSDLIFLSYNLSISTKLNKSLQLSFRISGFFMTCWYLLLPFFFHLALPISFVYSGCTKSEKLVFFLFVWCSLPGTLPHVDAN